MRRQFIFAFAALAAACSFSCSRQETAVSETAPVLPGSAIVFTVDGGFLVTTKTDAVSSLSSFNCIATDAGTEAKTMGSSTFSCGTTTKYTGGWYWPASSTSYHFYASNAALTHTATGCTVSPSDGSTDVVVAYLSNPTYKSENALTFNHIFARVGTVSLTASGSGSVTVSSITLKSVATGGTYNLKTAAWTPSSTKADKTLTHGSNDLYVVPGTYTLSVKYTYTHTAAQGGYSKEFTKTSDVVIAQGKTNKISGTLSSDATATTFTVSVTAWSDNSISVTM